MKIRRAHRGEVTKRPALRAPAASIAGIAGLALTMTPASHATAPSPAGEAAWFDHGSVIRPGFREVLTVVAQHSDAALASYTVKPGQSLSEIASEQCDGQSQDWTGIYAASRKNHQTAWNANDLAAGQQLTIECYDNPGMADRAPQPPPPPPVLTAVTVSQPDPPSNASPGPVGAAASRSNSGGGYGNVGTSSGPGGAFGACVVARESGGNSQVMNASGHYGLYQFAAGTWAEYGGNPADFGHASVSEQEQVFSNALAQGGQSNWSAYDGC